MEAHEELTDQGVPRALPSRCPWCAGGCEEIAQPLQHEMLAPHEERSNRVVCVQVLRRSNTVSFCHCLFLGHHREKPGVLHLGKVCVNKVPAISRFFSTHATFKRAPREVFVTQGRFSRTAHTNDTAHFCDRPTNNNAHIMNRKIKLRARMCLLLVSTPNFNCRLFPLEFVGDESHSIFFFGQASLCLETLCKLGWITFVFSCAARDATRLMTRCPQLIKSSRAGTSSLSHKITTGARLKIK